ncbi:GNAT family N-acetyltransferase [Geodermatophilus sabuli]|uniref:Acetyltransferase (GNAT) family protein n=1 Tax=Geodermatophilus sabuli TaxID=1564158 RepID=A0A285EFM1_9ACTN|nr:GNAT family N-acetyltransferase [Geodermatophilus sabuli]MBB3086427.1 GNAT superfamily N-acetyltransferase [Geodermatophilus sabuli]SNX97919.1 Acetyltransferase (GNAT) family protein [Geodermatophilus sabuli]
MDPTSPFPRFSGTADASVRRARPGDALGIAWVQQVTWRTAYGSVLPAEVLDHWDEEAATARWSTAVVAPPTPAHGVLVALEGDALVGFAAFGPPEVDPDERSHPAGPTTEVATLLVEPRWGRRGHGSRLLAAVADTARDSGAARLQVWLPEQDRVSAGFFESAGWAPDGWVRTLDTGEAPLREVRWHTLLQEEGE